MQTNKSKKYIITGNNIKLEMNNTIRWLSDKEKPFIYAIYAIVLKYQSNKYDDYDFQIIPPIEDFSAEDAASSAFSASSAKFFAGSTAAAECVYSVAAAKSAKNIAEDAANAAEDAAKLTYKAAEQARKAAAEQARKAAAEAKKNHNDEKDYVRAAVYALYYGSLCMI